MNRCLAAAIGFVIAMAICAGATGADAPAGKTMSRVEIW